MVNIFLQFPPPCCNSRFEMTRLYLLPTTHVLGTYPNPESQSGTEHSSPRFLPARIQIQTQPSPIPIASIQSLDSNPKPLNQTIYPDHKIKHHNKPHRPSTLHNSPSPHTTINSIPSKSKLPYNPPPPRNLPSALPGQMSYSFGTGLQPHAQVGTSMIYM